MTLIILGTTRQGMLRAVSYVLHAHCRFYLGRFFSLAMGFQDVPRMYYLANFIYMVLQQIDLHHHAKKNVRRAYGGMSCRIMVQRHVRSALR